jgi:hypothetical protein
MNFLKVVTKLILGLVTLTAGLVTSVCGVLFLLFACIAFSTSDSDLNREISDLQLKRIEVVTNYFDTIKYKENRYPTPKEWESWIAEQIRKDKKFENNEEGYIQYRNLPADVIEQFGTPPIGGYVWTWWDGDSDVRYVSWSNTKNARISESDYFVYGSKLRDVARFSLISLCFFSAGICCFYYIYRLIKNRSGTSKLLE